VRLRAWAPYRRVEIPSQAAVLAFGWRLGLLPDVPRRDRLQMLAQHDPDPGKLRRAEFLRERRDDLLRGRRLGQPQSVAFASRGDLALEVAHATPQKIAAAVT